MGIPRAFAAMVGVVLMLCVLAVAPALSMGQNGGIRLLLHVEEADIPSGGRVVDNPCLALPPITSAEDLVADYDGDADTVMVWVYLHHPRGFEVRGLGFGIEYEGLRVVTSGSCAPQIWQEEESMGKWAQSGSEIAFTWGYSDFPTGQLVALGWFVLAREECDAYFSVFEGTSGICGMVADTNTPPKRDYFWAYGKIGFGAIPGELPLAGPAEISNSWGAVTITAQ
ncbi:MAG: hypothetical protein KAY24_15140 [Candidatus Eisenbacteria sp.]|nr:hypothetical protein [Candidatus Eisenbacteria bacterium]